MATVELTKHLFAFFPKLEDRTIEVSGSTVAEVVNQMENMAKGFSFYVCDECGRLRQHVNIYVDGEAINDRGTLTDPVAPGSRVMILQALSGG